MDEKAFQRYLATGDYAPSAVPAEDMSLAEHDARWHPNGYKEGDKCLFRANLDKGDKGDADVDNATPREGGISGIFTGSAADYSKPSLMKIGTGEGTQVYGWGLYGSNVRGVAESYTTQSGHKVLLDGKPYENGTRIQLMLSQIGSVDGAIARLRDEPEGEKYAKWIEDNRDRITIKPQGNIYEQTFFTNRAPGDESHLLKWYEPVSDENIKRVMNQYAKENDGADLRADTPSGTITLEDFGDRKMFGDALKENEDALKADGASLYRYVSGVLGSEQASSEFLYRAGIDGIKYPVDSFGGKTIKDGDKAGWNYVSFSDDNIRVDRKWRDGEEVDDAARTKIERYLALDASPLDPEFEEKHPRGNPGNKGQFRKSEKTLAKLDEADASVGSASTPQGGGKVSPAEDAAYLAAVKKGDIETASKMVRKAAAKAMPETKVLDEDGSPKVVYHDSGERHNVLSRDYARKSMDIEAVYFHEIRDEYHEYGPVEHAVFLNIKNPANFKQANDGFDYGSTDDAGVLQREKLQRQGFDGFWYTSEEMGGSELAELGVFESTQIKSADPVTYDDEGKVIPLSNRFDFTNPDIRY